MSYLRSNTAVATRRSGRTPSITLAIGLVLTALLSTLLLPTSAFGADNVQLTVNVNVIPARATLSTTDVTTYVAYQVSFTNGNKSTLTQTRLRIRKPSIAGSSATATFFEAYPAGLATACDGGGSNLAVDCWFGQLKPGKTIALTFLFQLPMYGAVSPTELVFAKDDTFVTVKEGLSDGSPAANQDTFTAASKQVVDLVSVPEDSGGNKTDFFATYTPADGGTWGTNGTDIQANTAQLGAGNRQATKVRVPATNNGTATILKEIEVTAEDQTGCPSGETCFGDISQITIPDLSGKLVVFIRWDKSLVKGVNLKKVRVAWDPSDDGSFDGTPIARCDVNPNAAKCSYPAVRLKDGDYLVKVVLDHNGRIRGM